MRRSSCASRQAEDIMEMCMCAFVQTFSLYRLFLEEGNFSLYSRRISFSLYCALTSKSGGERTRKCNEIATSPTLVV